MAVVHWVLGLSLLTQGCLGSLGHSKGGCMKWNVVGDNVCCESCHPGNHLATVCGLNPKDLCTPCEPGTFNLDPKVFKCKPCTQCVGALVLEKQCTATQDTKCGCQAGLLCGDDQCSFCVDKCGKGQEPKEDRSCRPCPHGTFNDQSHQKCKPWSTKCPNPSQNIVAQGDALADILCKNISVSPSHKPGQRDTTAWAWPIVVSVVVVIALLNVAIILAVAMKRLRKKRKTPVTVAKTLIIESPTDDPRTLIAVECSFHEAEQERGSSSESLASKDSADQLIA